VLYTDPLFAGLVLVGAGRALSISNKIAPVAVAVSEPFVEELPEVSWTVTFTVFCPAVAVV
jgi:hypothetical protein